ncbi:hypothetical protein MYK68_14010 [Gordonia sp. PP30]|nr:hypothetical protein [Gordonia sp. PP30]UQE73845.1 hypothetical protein MYK68_14010 [Gordonia sp. PP30]
MMKLYAPRTGVEAQVADDALAEKLLGEGWTKTRRKPKTSPPAGTGEE